MLVADGLGEGGAGSVASRVALSTIAHLALHYGKWNVRIDPATADADLRARGMVLLAGRRRGAHARLVEPGAERHDDGADGRL